MKRQMYDPFTRKIIWEDDPPKRADLVEVVRCKDCKWWKTNYSWNGKEHKVCVIEPYEPVRKPDDYCSRGERKDDEHSD